VARASPPALGGASLATPPGVSHGRSGSRSTTPIEALILRTSGPCSSDESCLGRRTFWVRSVAVKAVIQRVTMASVTAEERLVSQIGPGLLILLGVQENDTETELDWLVGKVSRLRIFPDETGAMNRSVQDVGGAILVVSQFTLLADTRKGNRPSFIRAAAPGIARQNYEEFCLRLERETGKSVARGVFGAHMKISLVNDGPVTICMDTRDGSA